MKELYEQTKARLLEKGVHKAEKVNKGRCQVIFEEGDLVWLHLRKEGFPVQRHSKLSPRGDGPFKVKKKVSDNAYVLELSKEYGVSPVFNVGDLTPYEKGDLQDSRLNPFQEGDIDEGSSGIDVVSIIEGAITRSRAKELQHELTKLVTLTMAKALASGEIKARK